MPEGMRLVDGEQSVLGDIYDAVVSVVSRRRRTRRKSPGKKASKRRRKITKRRTKIVKRRKTVKRKSSKKRVGSTYYTKKGQPYKILSSGKARFIKGKRRVK